MGWRFTWFCAVRPVLVTGALVGPVAPVNEGVATCEMVGTGVPAGAARLLPERALDCAPSTMETWLVDCTVISPLFVPLT